MLNPNVASSPPALVKSFLDYVHQQGALVRVLESLTQRNSYVYNEEGCWFPDPDDPDPYFHFEGVKFGLVDESATIVVSEAECWQYVQQFVKTKVGLGTADMIAIERMLTRVV